MKPIVLTTLILVLLAGNNEAMATVAITMATMAITTHPAITDTLTITTTTTVRRTHSAGWAGWWSDRC